jgi:hypothetical protein
MAELFYNHCGSIRMDAAKHHNNNRRKWLYCNIPRGTKRKKITTHRVDNFVDT